MIQIDIPMPKCCLDCRFSWGGDSCTYCIAQCYHKPRGGYHLHKINFAYHSREEQEVWREPSCPLIGLEPRVMTLEEAIQSDAPTWYESKDSPELNQWTICLDESHGIGGYWVIQYMEYGSNLEENGADYGKAWRCWTSRPADEQREAEPWV